MAVWLDDLDRGALVDGSLARLAQSGQISGATGNPTIFAWSIASSAAYDGQLSELRLRQMDRTRRG
ncbi:transaldolase family protein [Kribbella sp. NPDC051936]|uniref:transaldolase family protein n=1 Tax=Kribbella sp. NPDC051936 TaxID=3154946 RepID=UPI00341ECFDA